MPTNVPAYVLGHTDPEIERLQVQAQLLDPVTRRLIRDCGIAPGMRVADLGCGAGDVSMLLAEAVGPSGTVLAFDPAQRAVDVGRERASHAGHDHLQFIVGTEELLAGYPAFDAVIGRYVLFHQPDPAAMIRRAAEAVCSGGIVAFQEMAPQTGSTATPPVDLWRDVWDSICGFACGTFGCADVSGSFVRYFEQAGLPVPTVTFTSSAGGAHHPYVRFSALAYRVFLPAMQQHGFARPEVGDMATLPDRLRDALSAVQAQFISIPEGCAWSVRP